MVRQMLRKVRVMDPGDTDLLMGTLMDITDFTDANAEVVIAGGIPATARPVLMGITKRPLKPTHSCLPHPSKKQLAFLQMQPFVVNAITFSVLKRMLLSVRLSQQVQVWPATVI